MTAGRWLAIWLVGVGFVVGSASTFAQQPGDPPALELPEGTRPAIALLTPRPMIPQEVLGAKNPPEVSVRLTVGETGRVTEVDVLEIDPSGPLDEHYRKAVVESILQWRYAPATKDGNPVSVMLRLTVAFPTSVPRPFAAGVVLRPADAPLVSDRSPDRMVEVSAMLRALPLKQRQAMLSRLSNTAIGLMDPEDIQKHVGARFLTVS